MLITSLPNTAFFIKSRCYYWRFNGYEFSADCFIGRGVYFIGKVTIGSGSSISNNCFLNGGKTERGGGIYIGSKVMIAPNNIVVAFSHGYHDLNTTMIDQPWFYEPIYIEDDVWIGANCTIMHGVRIGKGSIVSANSVVNKDIKPYSIVRGVPARVIGSRLENRGTSTVL